ncbi:MAG: hypothetical protein HC819_08915 [Cyclobacteriaceae bacterium]|nr:hypothetical protein [Cyclobacteriaceae bacterium]
MFLFLLFIIPGTLYGVALSDEQIKDTDQLSEDFYGVLENFGAAFSVRFTQYDTTHFNSIINKKQISVDQEIAETEFLNSSWQVHKALQPIPDQPGAYDMVFTFRCIKGASPATSVSFDIAFDNWSTQNFVLMPAAVYNGNRVKSQRHLYCPFVFDTRDIGPDKPQVISDVPRLNIDEGPSRIQQRTGDMSTPSIGFYNPDAHQGFWLLTTQATGLGDSGMDIEENKSRSRATMSVTAPVVRERYRYFIADNQYPSTDKPFDFRAGDSVSVAVRLYFFDSRDVQGLFNKFAEIRNDVIPKGEPNFSIPFSKIFEIQEEKFNRQNFESNFGYYSVGLRENYYQDWQIGWTGGMISTFPLFVKGGGQTKQNVIRNFDWLFPAGIAPSGYFWDTGQKGTEWFGIFPTSPVMKDWHLVRKSGDGLYYVLKQFQAFEKEQVTVKQEWINGAEKVAGAFVKTWKENAQLGQYVDNYTGEIVLGGSTSGGIVPAALVLAADYYKRPEYLGIAEQIAEYFYINYVKKGITYGGPGDAMANFDSESAYGLLESYTILHEYTRNEKWLKMAEELAVQFTTWVQSYDYTFPEESTLGKLGKTTTGVVWANTQNKHGAPGICTHSGLALLRLYRATGNVFYAEILRDITSAIPQYLSTADNPIEGLQPGWVSERVNTSDWLEGIGEIMHGSTWAETALMLTITEIPGIYIDVVKKLAFSFDQVKILNLETRKNGILIQVHNPTAYAADFNIMADYSPDQKLVKNAENYKIVRLMPGETKNVSFPLTQKK